MDYEDDVKDFCIQSKVALKEDGWDGTFKILNFCSLMNKLKPYFYEIFPKEFIDNLVFMENNEETGFMYKNSSFIIKDPTKLNNLIFGGENLSREDFFCSDELEKFNEFFNAVFPIPFVHMFNLNCT